MKTFEERFAYTSSIPKLDKFGEDLNDKVEKLIDKNLPIEDVINILRRVADKYEEELNRRGE
jgi:hypothetical protein